MTDPELSARKACRRTAKPVPVAIHHTEFGAHRRVDVSDNRVPVFVKINPDMRLLTQLHVEIVHDGRGGDKGSGLTGDDVASHGDLDDVIARLDLIWIR